MRLAGEVTSLPEEVQPLEQLRLGTRVVALHLTNQAEVDERTSGPCRIAGFPPGLQRVLVTRASRVQVATQTSDGPQSAKCSRDPLHVAQLPVERQPLFV